MPKIDASRGSRVYAIRVFFFAYTRGQNFQKETGKLSQFLKKRLGKI